MTILRSAISAPPCAIETVDFGRAEHRASLIALLDEYARSPEGGGFGLTAEVRATLCDMLAARPHYRGWLALVDHHAVGLLNGFEGVSTFRAHPLLNIHDIIVSAKFRRRGIARALLARAESHARERDCCKLTLEVLEGNTAAISVYRDAGYRPYELHPAMGRALFFEKMIR